MSPEDAASESPVVFQATVTAEHDVIRTLDRLDIDQLPGTEAVAETRTSFEALLRLDQVEALVDAGATVTLKRTIGPTLPQEAAMMRADPLDRLRPLEPYREDEER